MIQEPGRADGLGDILERVLDKGVVVAGDVSVSLVGIELLTIRLRLVIASVDKAVEMGINWWESDPTLNAQMRAQAGTQTQDAAIAAPEAGAEALPTHAMSTPKTTDGFSNEDRALLMEENRLLRGRLALLEARMGEPSPGTNLRMGAQR